MALFESIARQAGRLVGDVQVSVKRARLEGERRVIQRAHRNALEALGERAFDLATAGKLPDGLFASHVAAVERKLIELDSNRSEIDAVRAADEPTTDGAVPDPGAADDSNGAGHHAGAGWEAADRFFRRSP